MAKVQGSMNYEKFVLNDFNRDVNDTKALERSMKKYGWLDAYPMHTVERNGFYVIIGGHNRFQAAKNIGIPVKFVVEKNDDVSVPELEEPTKPWSLLDYLVSHARTGKQDYIDLKHYMNKTGFSLSICIPVCAGATATTQNKYLSRRFKEGTYKTGNQDHAKDLLEIAKCLDKIGVTFCRRTNFVKAISKCILVPEFNSKLFFKKSKTHKHLFEKKPTIDDYVDLIDLIYNRGSRNQIPLAFSARKISRERQLFKK